jgi:hypothetical protein
MGTLLVTSQGDEIAVDLEWTGPLAVPVMGLAAGSAMKAFVAMLVRFRESKVIQQRSYDCYPPRESARPPTDV